MGDGGARFALQIELFRSLLSCKGAFFGVLDGLVEENFSGGEAPDPQFTMA